MIFTAVRAKNPYIPEMLVISVVTLKYLIAVQALVERNGLCCSALGAGRRFPHFRLQNVVHFTQILILRKHLIIFVDVLVFVE